MSAIVNDLSLQDSKNASASVSVANLCSYSALRTIPLNSPLGSLTSNSAVTLKLLSDWNFWISRSLSTISLTATDCTRPAESCGFSFFHNTGESLNPTIRSSTRRACWALTRFKSMVLGCFIASKMACLVISWNTIRFVCSTSRPSTWARCHDIASPSRSSSDASHTLSELLAAFFNLPTTSVLSSGISYTGANVSVSILRSFFFRSRICP